MRTARFYPRLRVRVLCLCLTWAAMAAAPVLAGSGGFSATGSMNVARDEHTAALLGNGQVLVAGGENSTTGFLASAELYNPSTGKWTLTGSLHTARYSHAMVLLANGKVLVAGGVDPTGCCGAPPLASAELYDPSTGTWTETGSMTTPRATFAMVLLPNGQVLAAGGDNNGTFLSSAELYNPTAGTWSSTTSMTSSSFEGGITLQSGQAFVLGNLNLYTPATSNWTVVANRPQQAGGGPIALLLANNNVFLAGGTSPYGEEIVNPTTSQWTNVAPPPCTTTKQHCEGACVLLTTGKILVAGGITEVNASPYPNGETNGLAALLDLSTLTWASTGSMSKSRVGETATLLPNGKVLFAGGETFEKGAGALVPIATAELYTP